MAGNILTPSAIWGSFKINDTPKTKIVDTTVDGAISFMRLYIDGIKTSKGQTEVFALFAKPMNLTNCPSLLMINEFGKEIDIALVKSIVKRGCSVLVIDLEGKKDGKEHFTNYPEDLEFAKYEVAKENLFGVPGSAIGTCWFVWTCLAKFALRYLEKEPSVTNIGVFGLGDAATVAWQVAGTETDLKCALFALNAGWTGYRGIYKFAGMVEPQFSEETYKFIAGVEPQTYAGHVKCPSLVLATTNSNKFDFDRVYDTVSKMTAAEYRGATYSVNESDAIDGRSFASAMIFLEKYLILGGADNQKLPAEAEIKCEIEDCKLKIEVKPEEGDIKSVDVFVSEEISIPSERAWQKLNAKKSGEGYYATFEPYYKSGSVTTFAQVNYKNGFSVGTMVVNKKFSESDVCVKNKSKILYSSRYPNSEYTFAPASGNSLIYTTQNSRVKVAKGPMGIEGVYSKYGLLTFKFKAEKDKPEDGAILMFDVFSAKSGELRVKLISDYHGAKVEYIAYVKLVGGEVWQNVKLETNKFKTVEGMPLKSYDAINAMEFVSENEFLLNNALWV